MTTPPPLVGIAANPSSSFRRTGEVGRGSDLAAVRRNSYAGSFATFVRRSSESLPSSPDAGPACIIGKELAGTRSTRPNFVFFFRAHVPNEFIPINPLGMTTTYFREDKAFK